MSIPEAVSRKVQAIVSSHHYGSQIMKELGRKERPRLITDIYRVKLELIRGGLAITDLEFLKFFEALDKAGVGKLILEKTPGHNKFKWSYNMLHVVEAARSAAPSAQLKPIEVHKWNTISRTSVAQVERDNSLVVEIPYRDKSVTIRLPEGFNENDVDRLAAGMGAFLKAILKLRS
jgi:hypothetical protein